MATEEGRRRGTASMPAAARLGLYGGGLALAFAAAFVVGDAAVPQRAVDAWSETAEEEGMEDHDEPDRSHAAAPPRGLAIEQDGYLLGEIGSPPEAGVEGELAFHVIGPDGEPLTDFATEHEQELHLVVVRGDGTGFRHAHPAMGEDGTWSLPWTWEAAGSYRVYADFSPAADEDLDVTLARTVEVGGSYAPAASAEPVRTTEVDGFDVTLRGDLAVGSASELTAEVTRDGRPVTELEPYLGAYGHLVALREGDLAYLHVHPEDGSPGPEIAFATEAPTEGRYLLYLEFQVEGRVHTAAFAVDALGH